MKGRPFRRAGAPVDAVQVSTVWDAEEDPLWLAFIKDSGGLDRDDEGRVCAVFDGGGDRPLDPTDWIVHDPATEAAWVETDASMRDAYTDPSRG